MKKFNRSINERPAGTVRAFRAILLVQTIIYALVALWALIHIDSFMLVTGPKTDIWLVKTVSLLSLAVTFCFITQLLLPVTDPIPVTVLAMSCCVFFATLDFYYAGTDVISDIYLVDGVIQVLLLCGWLILVFSSKTGLANRHAGSPLEK
jgi:hypothetical protein